MFVYNYITHAIIIEVVGFLAGILAAAAISPQIIRAWKTKSTNDISPLWMGVYMSSLILWLIYGLGINSYPLIVMTVIETGMLLWLIFLMIKYK